MGRRVQMAECLVTEEEKHEISLELRALADDFLKPMTRQDLKDATSRIHEIEFGLYDKLEGI